MFEKKHQNDVDTIQNNETNVLLCTDVAIGDKGVPLLGKTTVPGKGRPECHEIYVGSKLRKPRQ